MGDVGKCWFFLFYLYLMNFALIIDFFNKSNLNENIEPEIAEKFRTKED